jgi:lysophospholipase L1-like esterase
MSAAPQGSESPLALRLLSLGGFAAVGTLMLAWSDHIPSGYSLRKLVEPPNWSFEREVLEHAADRLDRFDRENVLVAPGTIVFLGSSTIERYPLEACFPGKPCANRGIGSASVALLQRFADVLVPPAPTVSLGGIVLYAGSIDLREPGRASDPDHADAVAASVRTLIEAVRMRQPDAPILVVGVLPARTTSGADVAVLARLNAHLREIARDMRAVFVDTARAPLTATDGSLAIDRSADELHLNVRGYAVLSKWIVSDGGELGRRLAP